MDETKGLQEGVPSGDVSSVETPEAPSTSTEMLTKEQAEKLANERHSKLDREISDLKKATAKAASTIQAAEDRAQAAEAEVSKAQKAKDEAEYEAARGNPDTLTLYERNKVIREAEVELKRKQAELKRSQLEHEEAIKEIADFKITKLATEIASKYKGVEASTLIELTDGTPEKMEKLAQKLSGTKPPKEPEEKPEPPDSGETKGGGGDAKYKGMTVLHDQ